MFFSLRLFSSQSFIFMRKVLFLFSLLCFTLFVQGQSPYNHFEFKDLPALMVQGKQGVSAPYAGAVGQTIIVAGGCNFPTTPAAAGGTKVFYDDIYTLDLGKQSMAWQQVGKLPYPLAYGVSVTTPKGIVCIGGTSDGIKSRKEGVLLSYQQGKIALSSLPPLPIGLDNMAGAYAQGYVYIVGGISDGNPTRSCYRLAIEKHAAQWEALPDFPGAARVQPVVAVQNGATNSELFLFGGYDPLSKKVASDGWALSIKTNTWRSLGEIVPQGEKAPVTLVGATATATGTAHILCWGGVNTAIFQQALRQPLNDYLTHRPEWYRFNRRLLAYHTITNTWVYLAENERLARAGAAIVPVLTTQGKTTWCVINGEIKPGIRSSQATAVEMTKKANFGGLNWSILILYLIGMLLLGYYFMKQEGNSDDFFKGGGRIPWWAAGISIFATMLSAITYMAIPAKAYATDWTYYPMQMMILVVSFPVIKYYLPFFRRLNVTTAYQYLEQRFNYATRAMASALFIVFMVARTALVLYLPSLAMEAVTGIDIFLCIILMALITILYCTMGGVEAVVWGDVVQGIILVGGAFFAAAFLMMHTEGGTDAFFKIGWENDKFRLFEWSFDYRSATFWVVILGGLANNLISYSSDQTVIQRYLTTKDEKSAARSILTNGLMSVVVTIAFFTIGTGLYTFYKTHPASLDLSMQRTDAIFPFFMMSELPAGIAGLLIAAIFAATMSTISSNINSISTAFTMDFYKKVRPEASDKAVLKTARWAVAISGLLGMLIALLMATTNIQSLLDYFNTILGLLSGSIGGLFIMGIFFPRINATAALIGFLAGTLSVFYLNYYTSTNFLIFGAISIFISVTVAWLAAPIFPNKKSNSGLTWKSIRSTIKSF